METVQILIILRLQKQSNLGIYTRFSPTPILDVFTLFWTFLPSKPQKLGGKGPEPCIYDQSKIIFIYLWILILMYFWHVINILAAVIFI